MNKNKPEPHLKYSNTFKQRCICKWCKGGPDEYYFTRNPNFFKNHRFTLDQFKYIQKNVKRMCEDYYLGSNPAGTTNLSDFNFPISFKGYSPKIHRTRGASSRTNVTEMLTCKCGRTSWAFNYKSTEERKEITMRQSSKRHI